MPLWRAAAAQWRRRRAARGSGGGARASVWEGSLSVRGRGMPARAAPPPPPRRAPRRVRMWRGCV
jgi:hypothetical protein